MGGPDPGDPEIESVERCDPWLAGAALHEIARTWAASWDVSHPRVSPISGDFEGLPPVDLWVGVRDVYMPDSRRLRDLMGAAGVEVNYVEQPAAIHVSPCTPSPRGGPPARTWSREQVRRWGLPRPRNR